MGAYISNTLCVDKYNITTNCNWTAPNNVGGLTHGEFQPDPDIAGNGVVNVFFSVTAFALGLSLLYLIFQVTSILPFTGLGISRHSQQGISEQDKQEVSGSQIFEGLIMSCSDQQIFTGGAYALSLRYSKGCTISAYHYNIIAETMLITCATHLCALSVVSKYWEHKLLALLRIVLVTGIYIVTGLLLSNQNVAKGFPFPTEPPGSSTDFTLLPLRASCFQGGSSPFAATMTDSFQSADHLAVKTIGQSSPSKGKVAGWNFFIVTLLWFIIAVLAEFVRFFFRKQHKSGNRNGPRWEKILIWAERGFWAYQAIGTGIGMAMIITSRLSINRFRAWFDSSVWIKLERGNNPENDVGSFSQLVPIFLTALTVFTFVQLINDKLSPHFRHWFPCCFPSSSKPTASSEDGYSPFSETPTEGIPEKKHSTIYSVQSVQPNPGLNESDAIHQSFHSPRQLVSPNSPTTPRSPTSSQIHGPRPVVPTF